MYESTPSKVSDELVWQAHFIVLHPANEIYTQSITTLNTTKYRLFLRKKLAFYTLTGLFYANTFSVLLGL